MTFLILLLTSNTGSADLQADPLPELDKSPRMSLDMAKLFNEALLKDILGAQSSDQNNQVKLCAEVMTRRL